MMIGKHLEQFGEVSLEAVAIRAGAMGYPRNPRPRCLDMVSTRDKMLT
jgi:hypothetical protein